MKRLRSDSGAAAVEFALIAPLLILLVVGIIEFSRAYNAQVSLTAAAREGVRVLAIQQDPKLAASTAKLAAGSLNPTLLTPSPLPDSGPPVCDANGNVTFTLSYPSSTLTGFWNFGPMTGIGVMRCGG